MRYVRARSADDQTLVGMGSRCVMCSIKFVHGEKLEQQEPEIPSRTDVIEDGRPLRFVVIRTEAVDTEGGLKYMSER